MNIKEIESLFNPDLQAATNETVEEATVNQVDEESGTSEATEESATAEQTPTSEKASGDTQDTNFIESQDKDSSLDNKES